MQTLPVWWERQLPCCFYQAEDLLFLRLTLPSVPLVGCRLTMRAASPSSTRRQTSPGSMQILHARRYSLSVIQRALTCQGGRFSGRTTASRPDELPQGLCGLRGRFHRHQVSHAFFIWFHDFIIFNDDVKRPTTDNCLWKMEWQSFATGTGGLAWLISAMRDPGFGNTLVRLTTIFNVPGNLTNLGCNGIFLGCRKPWEQDRKRIRLCLHGTSRKQQSNLERHWMWVSS